MAKGPLGRLIRFGACALAFLGLISSAPAEEFRILYAEPVMAPVRPSAGDEPQKISSLSLAFDAYGRRFDLDLESNDHLLGELTPEARSRLASVRILKGQVRGLAGSWVRVTIANDEMHGAIWDGNDLYALSPAADAVSALVTPLAASQAQNVIYRLKDTQSGLEGAVCVTLQRSAGRITSEKSSLGGGDLSPAEAYRKLVDELRQLMADVPLDQLEVAVHGDFELRNTFGGGDLDAVALARLNIVDGIFSEQLGVAIVVSDIRISDTADDPFPDTFDAEQLIQDVASYRDSTPEIRQRGLAHLLTGRNLNGNIIGIAYLDALCEPYFGVSLSEGFHNEMMTALIVAHELGHNFGAPHDNELGSACQSTPPGFLMEPFFNGSSTFSECSLLQMRPSIEAAACVTASRLSDVALEVPPSPLAGVTGEPLQYVATVSAVGTAASEDVAVTLDYAGFPQLTVESATTPGGTCAIAPFTVTCQLGSIAVGTSRQVELQIRAAQVGTININATASATRDRVASNNTGATQLVFETGIRLTSAPEPITGAARKPLAFTLTSSVLATRPLENGVLTFERSDLIVQSITPTQGSCSSPAGFRITCSLGTIAAGGNVVVDVRATAQRSGLFGARATLAGTIDGAAVFTARSISANLTASADVSVVTQPARVNAVPGQVAVLTTTVQSSGPEPAENVRVTLSPSAFGLIQSVDAGAAPCTLNFSTVTCSFGTIEAGGTRAITTSVRSDEVSNHGLIARSTADNNDNPNNDESSVQILYKHLIDVAISPTFPIQSPEGLVFAAFVELRSQGSATATGVVTTLTLPTSIEVVSTQVFGAGNCTIGTSTVTCDVPSMDPGTSRTLRIELRANATGTFTGAVTTSAPNDAEPLNDTRSLQFQIAPLVDAGIELPFTTLTVAPDEIFDVPFTVRAGAYPLSDVTVFLRFAQSFDALSIIPSSGSCTPDGSQHVCALGSLTARSSWSVTLRLRPRHTGSSGLSATVIATGDVDPSNNSGSVQVLMPAYIDAGLNFDASLRSLQINQNLVIPFRVTTNEGFRLQDAQLAMSLPSGMVFDGAVTNGATCALDAGSVRCNLGTLESNVMRSIDVTVHGTQAGRFASTIRLVAAKDSFPANNEGTIEFNFRTPDPPPSSGSGGAGGGGGSFGPACFLLLLPLLGRRRRKRTGDSNATLH